MATNFFDTAKSVRTGAEDLLDRIKTNREALSQLLASAKAAESRLIEKEQREQREQAEREKAERLKKFLESGESNAYVADEADQVKVAAAQDAPEPPAEQPSAAEAPAQPEAPVQPAPAPAKPVQRTVPPAQKPAYVAREERPRRDNGPRPGSQDRRPGDNRPAASGDRPRRDGTAPRNDRPLSPQSGSRAVIINPSSGSRDQNRNRNNNNYDKDKKAKNKKAMQKENGPSVVWDEDGSMGNRRKGKNSKQETVKPSPVVIDHAVITSETITVKELSEKIGKPAAEIIKKLFLVGIMATINQDIDFDTCELIANDYGITLEQQIAKSYEDVLADNAQEEDRRTTPRRRIGRISSSPGPRWSPSWATWTTARPPCWTPSATAT